MGTVNAVGVLESLGYLAFGGGKGRAGRGFDRTSWTSIAYIPCYLATMLLSSSGCLTVAVISTQFLGGYRHIIGNGRIEE